MNRTIYGVVVLMGMTVQASALESYSESPNQSRIMGGGVFLEPMILGSSQESSIKASQVSYFADDTTGKIEAAGLGVKLGAHLNEVFILGVDLRYARQMMKDSFYENATGNSYTFGPTVAVQMPFYGLRLLGTYVMNGEFDPEPGTYGLDLGFREARGPRYGIGFRALAVSINLEYEDLVYDKTNIQAIGETQVDSATNVDYGSKGYNLSVSFPMQL
jgi:hypothetical protein